MADLLPPTLTRGHFYAHGLVALYNVLPAQVNALYNANG